MLIEIPFMSSIFGIFTQFIYAHMIIYRNLIPNITKGQKRDKNYEKSQVYTKRLYYILIMTLMNAIFDMFTNFIYDYMIFYTN